MEGRDWRTRGIVVSLVCAVVALFLGVASIALNGGTPWSVMGVVVASFTIGMWVLVWVLKKSRFFSR